MKISSVCMNLQVLFIVPFAGNKQCTPFGLSLCVHACLSHSEAPHLLQQQQQMQQRTMGRMVMRRQKRNAPTIIPAICPMVKSAKLRKVQ